LRYDRWFDCTELDHYTYVLRIIFFCPALTLLQCRPKSLLRNPPNFLLFGLFPYKSLLPSSLPPVPPVFHSRPLFWLPFSFDHTRPHYDIAKSLKPAPLLQAFPDPSSLSGAQKLCQTSCGSTEEFSPPHSGSISPAANPPFHPPRE